MTFVGKKGFSRIQRTRLSTKVVDVGPVSIGGENPIRIQSMVTSNTMNTEETIDQCIKLSECGCELIRITAPHPAAANNLSEIQKGLRKKGIQTPLIADIHYMPKAAEIAARIVSKVRINPGNYSDRKLFKNHSYTQESYQKELERIYKSVTPLIKICKKEGTVLRIGSNHGSLSDRILSQYGDTPLGMVESALEFVRICEDLDYRDLVISMKASNPKVMVAAYRLLVEELLRRGGPVYPLHLGVTEAGSKEEGRIKSAVGIGSLLQGGIGDTIRVSLTEDSEKEIPVAQKIVNLFWFTPTKTPTERELLGTDGSIKDNVYCFGGLHTPKVIIKNVKESDFNDEQPDIFWEDDDFRLTKKMKEENRTLDKLQILKIEDFIRGNFGEEEVGIVLTKQEFLKHAKEIQPRKVVCILESDPSEDLHKILNQINSFCIIESWNVPIIVKYAYVRSGETEEEKETYAVELGTRLGSACLQRWISGIVLEKGNSWEVRQILSLYQSSRLRISKPDYISCPSCGRTQFDLQKVTNKIQERTSHLKGVKIGIMGCIVNGPGEMADADFGYVGTGEGVISLYKGQTVVRKDIPEEIAVESLINLIKENKMWIDP